MNDTVKTTLSYYNDHAINYAVKTNNVDMTTLYDAFVKLLPIGSKHILDVGCGSGRDAHYFARLGYQLTAIDGSKPLIDWAIQQSSKDIDFVCLTFDEMTKKPWSNKFAGIWACASLLHIEYESLVDTLDLLINYLVTAGVLYASFKYGNTERYEDGRFLCDMDEERMQSVLDLIGTNIQVTTWVTTDKLANRSRDFINILIVKN